MEGSRLKTLSQGGVCGFGDRRDTGGEGRRAQEAGLTQLRWRRAHGLLRPGVRDRLRGSAGPATRAALCPLLLPPPANGSETLAESKAQITRTG